MSSQIYAHVPYRHDQSTELKTPQSYAYPYPGQLSNMPSLGKPSKKRIVSWKDILLIAVVVGCLAAAICSVFQNSSAVYLGQTNQLVIVGFCLAVIALITQRQLSTAFLLYQVQHGTLTLQDLEAIIRTSLFISRTGVLSRLLLLLLLGLPLGLSVAYKRFVGGFSSIEIEGQAGMFGLSSPPGYQRIGLGVSLIPEVYLSFWRDPRTSSVYSFNLLVDTNDTSVVLDMPMPEYVTSIQSSLPADKSVVISALVLGTVAEDVPIVPEVRSNDQYWKDMMRVQFPTGHVERLEVEEGHWAIFMTGKNPTRDNQFYNYTDTYLSVWLESEGKTMAGEMHLVHITRRKCKATWRITAANITLIDAHILEIRAEAQTHNNQSLIENNEMEVASFYSRFVVEYDWVRHPRLRPINTVPSLVATMIWARLVTRCGPEEPSASSLWRGINQYRIDGHDVQTLYERETLRRSGALLFVLVLMPLLSVCATIAKIWMYSCPIDDDFGLISVLAAIAPRSLMRLKGAGLSGKLEEHMTVNVALVPNTDVAPTERVEVRLDENGEKSRIRRGVVYG